MSPHLNSCADRSTGKGDLKFCLKTCVQIQKNPSCSAQQAQVDSVSQTGLPPAQPSTELLCRHIQPGVHHTQHSQAAALQHQPAHAPRSTAHSATDNSEAWQRAGTVPVFQLNRPTQPGFVIILIFQNTTATWNLSVLK